jgi:hypothetical protein
VRFHAHGLVDNLEHLLQETSGFSAICALQICYQQKQVFRQLLWLKTKTGKS